MTTLNRGPATIYAFPPRGRFAAHAQHEETQSPAYGSSPRSAKITSGSSWYHEEAIREAETKRKN